ncbi:MAG: ABC transporter ATP-binding protein [Candidatus Woesebacteria bacterium]|jgi:ATP-binding cassette subfamily B protein
MKTLFKVLSFASNLWPYYLAITIFSVLLALSNQVSPFIIKGAADMVVAAMQGAQPSYLQAVLLALAYFGADVAGTIFSNLGGYYGDIMAARLKKQLSEKYYKHLLKLPQVYYDKELTGTIVNRLNRTIFELTNFMNFFANNFFQMILTMVFTLIVVSYYSWEVAALLFVIYPLFMWLTSMTSRSWQSYQEQKNQHIDSASGRFSEAISQIRVVKSFAQEKRELQHLQHHYQQNTDITKLQSKKWHQMDVLRRLVLNAIFFVIIGYIFWQTLIGRFSVGEMFLLIQFSALMRMPLFSMSFIVDQTQKAIAGSRDYFEVMQLQPAISDSAGAKSLRVTKGAIKYRDVSFAYDDGERVFKNISFDIKPGSKVALVGESGQGKTTLTSLLLRLYKPLSGQIKVDGMDIAKVTQKSLRKSIAVVFQEPALFSGTIKENIAYARPDATLRAIKAAAKAANADEFIKDLSGGYDAQIGEHGIKLSGGQKQRIAIARALLKDAPILILDEATSSLDSKAESQVQEALNHLMLGRTTLIIAHRLSTIAHVDIIITLKGGKIDEIGTPRQLAKTGGIYGQLLDLQVGMTEATKRKLYEFGLVTEEGEDA